MIAIIRFKITWGPVTADGADVFADRQWRAWGLRGHLHHAIDTQRWLNVLCAANWVHWRVQLEHRNTNTHGNRSQNSPDLLTSGIIHPITQGIPHCSAGLGYLTVVYNWPWRQEVWIKTAVQINLSGVTSWPTVLNNLENSGSGQNIMTSDGQHIRSSQTCSFFFLILPFAPIMSTRPLLVFDLNQAQQDPRMPQEIFYSCFQQAPPECPAKFKKYSRIKKHYLFKKRCNCCFESDFNFCSHP